MGMDGVVAGVNMLEIVCVSVTELANQLDR